MTEEILKKLGFTPIDNDRYCNGTQWILQVPIDNLYDDEVPNPDGTWFDGIGTWNYHKNGEMAVNVLCRGNYVCNSLSSEKEIRDMYFLMTGRSLEESIKEQNKNGN